MSTTIKYAALLIFLIVIIALIWALRDGFPVRNGRGYHPERWWATRVTEPATTARAAC